MHTYCDFSITNMWILNGFIDDLPLLCRRVKKQFCQVIRILSVHSLKVFQHLPDANCHHGCRKGGTGGKGPLDFENFSKKRCFLDFGWEKHNLTTFGPPKKSLEKSLGFPGKNPSDEHDCHAILQ